MQENSTIQISEETPQVSQPAHAIEVFTWREFGDDDDSLEFGVIPADAPETDPYREVLEENDLEDYDENNERNGGAFKIESMLLYSGQLVAYNGRTFRVTIEEVL